MCTGIDLLKRIETIRQKAEKSPKNYPNDYTIRLIQATIADWLGYKNRKEWTDLL